MEVDIEVYMVGDIWRMGLDVFAQNLKSSLIRAWHCHCNALVDSKIVLSRNKENLTIEELEFDGVEYETTVLLSDLRDNPAYTKYYTFLTR